MQQREHGCIYCGSDGPYNDEHAIPAGLGAGDSMLLRNLVCKVCNDAFSKLEVRVLRRGSIGLRRLAMQEHGRGRGSKTRAPAFESASEKLLTHDGRALEIALRHGLAPEILPQITQHGPMFEGDGSNRAKVEGFLTRLEGLLVENVRLIRKRPSAEKPHTALDLRLGPMGYVLASTEPIDKPDAKVVWLELPDSEISDDCPPRVFERRQGSIALQIGKGEVATAARFLSLVRANLTSLKADLSNKLQETEIEQSRVWVSSYAPFENEVARLLAKIGFNLLASDQGEALCRTPQFDALCASVRTGEPKLRMSIWDAAEGIQPLLRRIFTERHWMMLAPMPNSAGGKGLAFVCSLYGGEARLVPLTDEMPPGVEDLHAFFAVDYETHSVQRFDLTQVVDTMQTMMNTGF